MFRPHILILVIIALNMLILPVVGTLVTFYVDHQVQQPLDFVEINAIIKVNEDSLDKAIEDAAETIKSIEKLVEDYCKENRGSGKKKQNCNDLVDASAYSIKPQYEVEKKRQIFGGFIVAHEINIKVLESPSFGKLVDDILKIGVNKINSLEWKPKEQADGEQSAVQEGLQQAEQICKKLGSSLSKVLKVEEVTDFGEEKQEAQGEEDEDGKQEDEEDPLDIKDSIVYYKFVVECSRGKSK